MLFKLAIRNIRRSVKDYAIYFVTLLVAITVFYAFNSVSDQQVMHEIAESNKTNMVEFTNFMMGIFSTVVALVLGFLVIYANQLLIRRRKREFGMYFTLGMKPGQVSRIILYETVLVGLVSLVIGLALGVLVSQLLSFATAGIFGIPMPDYQFTFSMNAFIMTLICVAAIYVVVAVFNVFSIRRCKLIDLINAEAKNQKVAVRNPWICLALFIVSLIMLGIGYWQLQLNGMVFIGDDHFTIATVLMLVGTLLLFFSLAGFIVATITRMRGFYLKKLRPFTTRQIASKVNTSFASVWVVCILLFFAITTFATGMALADAFTSEIEEANPYDASVISAQSYAESETGENKYFDIKQTEQYLQEHVAGWDELVAKSARLDSYVLPDLTYGDVMAATNVDLGEEYSSIKTQNVGVISLSQFNDALALLNEPAVTLRENEYLVVNNMAAAQPIADAMVDQDLVIEAPNGKLAPLDESSDVQLNNFSVLSTGSILVVPDRVIESLPESAFEGSFLNLMFQPDSNVSEIFSERLDDSGVQGVTNVIVRELMIGQMSGIRVVVTYLALYIGLVLLIAVAAVLAIQLLSLTIDSLSRYRTLSRLGCDTRMLSRSLFAQVVLYFVLPLIVAVCHSAWTINLMAGSLFEVLGFEMLPSLLMAAAFVVVIYGGYMLITYFASRATVKQGLKESV